MNRLNLFLFLVTCLLIQSCNSQGTPPPSPIPATEIASTQPTPSTILHPAQLTGQTITLAVGDVFAVALPDESFTWQINFADTVIQILTPLEKMDHPDSPGWIFRALAPGQTEIRVTASAAICDPGTPCPPPAPITFVFTVEVK